MTALLDNLRRRTVAARRADAIVVSIPKSGRTWMRFFLEAYRAGGTTEQSTVGAGSGIALPPPDVFFTHERWGHRTTRNLKEYVLRENLLPDDLVKRKPVVLLARDPRDVIVSLYFQITRRERRLDGQIQQGRSPVIRGVDRVFVSLTHRGIYSGSLSGFLVDPLTGIRAVVTVMNEWLNRFSPLPRFRLLRYEDVRADPLAGFTSLLRAIGVETVNEQFLARAVAASAFENMQRLEHAGALDDMRLKPADHEDPESFKVRRGKIGGYRDYLAAADIAVVETALARLDPRFGYARGHPGAAPGDIRS